MTTQDYWQRQAAGKPLFPDMLWSRPENKQYAGKLLIIGGNAQGFASAATAYAEAQAAGAGVVRVLLPDALAKTLGKSFAAGEFAPSTPSGSFGSRALAEMLALAHWADGVLVDGDLGRNSETAIVIEKFISKYPGKLALASDTADIIIHAPEAALMRPETLLVINFSQLQKLLIASHFTHAATSDMGRVRLAELLHLFTMRHHSMLVVGYEGQYFVAAEGRVSSTPAASTGTGGGGNWQTVIASHAAVWWLQNPSKPYQAITTACAS